ncbi:MAG: (Na+)-NQR maturation NqrM [Alteromonadaceae bacterium]|nr:(Na+)-NQR maturation NqrM [Alteromonadaceae bacterium]
MSTFILAFVFFVAMVVAMAVGYLVQKKTISGSCGGLGALGIAKACDCPEPCDRKKARMEREAARQKKIAEWEKDKIL